MIVISDTTPINYLILIDEVDILPKLFGKIIIPSAVFRELQVLEAPEKVRAWIKNIPKWLEVKSISTPADISLGILDPGEREAIQLAKELNSSQILIWCFSLIMGRSDQCMQILEFFLKGLRPYFFPYVKHHVLFCLA